MKSLTRTKLLPTLTLITAMAAAGTAQAMDQAAALDWSKKNNCAACHVMDKKLVGPSWQDIGKKYAGDASAAAALPTKVRQGGKGVWGPVPMPPNPTVKDADAKAFVQFVLTLK